LHGDRQDEDGERRGPVAEVREQRQAGSAASVIAAMPKGKAKAALARRFKLA